MSSININSDELKKVGENLKMVVKDDMLILVVDLKEEIGVSASGKMMGIASTAGFTKIADFDKPLSMNVWVRKKK